MGTDGIVQLITLFLLLLFSAFFSSSETALTTANKVKIRSLADEGNKKADVLLKVLDNYDKMLSTILVGNNIVNISASALATTFTMNVIGDFAVSIATGVLTLLVLIFGEIVPKTSAMRNPEQTALSYAKPIQIIIFVLTPLVFIIDRLASFILKILGKQDTTKSQITESELRTYVDVSHEDGVIETGEREMIYNVFDFSDSIAKDIMIPRIDMTTVSLDANYDELMQIFCDSMYTRIPVYENEMENIIGFVNVKDFILVKDKTSFRIKSIVREAYYTYEYKKTSDLMFEMRKFSSSVAFVNDEYGATVGMITLEDLLEEIVGEIRDEYDQDEDELIKETPEGYLILAGMKLQDINDVLGTDFDSEDYDSIGGLVLEHLQRLPEDKEVIALEDGTTLCVRGVKQNRIMKVLVTLPPKLEDGLEPADVSD